MTPEEIRKVLDELSDPRARACRYLAAFLTLLALAWILGLGVVGRFADRVMAKEGPLVDFGLFLKFYGLLFFLPFLVAVSGRFWGLPERVTLGAAGLSLGLLAAFLASGIKTLFAIFYLPGILGRVFAKAARALGVPPPTTLLVEVLGQIFWIGFLPTSWVLNVLLGCGG